MKEKDDIFEKFRKFERFELDKEEKEEDNKLLSSKIEIYKEKIDELKNKLLYAQKLFILYENIMINSKKDNRELKEKIKKLEKEIRTLKKQNLNNE